jgi:hypothetical protein
VEPKLYYHGFKYDDESSYPPQGDKVFSRSYWCTTQKVSIGPIEYDLEAAKAVISRRKDFPTEVPAAVLLNREPGFRLWLSNRYLTAVLHSEHRSVSLIPERGIVNSANTQIHDKRFVDPSIFQPGRCLPTWWEFQGENDLRRTLKTIVLMIVTCGLDWFEEEVVHVKRYHEKLERRRQATKTRLIATE